MKISVLIAAYNAGKYIGKALESIRAQEHSDWELIVIEDGSRDETEPLVQLFAKSVTQPVRYENLGKNRGVAAARSRLLELATGEAMAFLDADDWWTPAHLSRAMQAFESGADVVVARIQLFDLERGEPLESYAPPSALFDDPVRALFNGSPIITSSCVALRRSLTQRVGEFDPAFRIGEDRDYWLRCALAGAVFADNGEVTCHYAKHAGSTMARTLLWAEQEVAFHEKYRDLAGVPASMRRRLLAHHLLNYGRLVRKSDARKSVRVLWRAWRLAPSRLQIFAHLLVSAPLALARGSR